MIAITSKPAWAKEQDPCQSGLHYEILSQKNQMEKNKRKNMNLALYVCGGAGRGVMGGVCDQDQIPQSLLAQLHS